MSVRQEEDDPDGAPSAAPSPLRTVAIMTVTEPLTDLEPILADICTDTCCHVSGAATAVVNDAGAVTHHVSVSFPAGWSLPTTVARVVASAATAGLATTAIATFGDMALVVASNHAGQLHAEIRETFRSELTWIPFTR